MRRDILAVIAVGVLVIGVVVAVQSARTHAQAPDLPSRFQATLTFFRDEEVVLHVIDTTTGRVWLVEDEDSWRDQGSPSAEPGPPGRYQAKTLSHPSREGVVWLYVVDTQTGAAWYHNSKGWWPVGQPPA